MKKFYILGLVGILFSGCQELNNTLGQISNTISSTKNSVNSAFDAPEQDLTPLIPALSDKAQKEQIAEAKPVIQKVLSNLACAKNTESSIFQKYAISNSVFRYTSTPIGHMENHVSGCVQITRLNNYRSIAKNAFSFDATFESPQSGEVQRRYFEVQKQPEGDWLFSGYGKIW